MYELHSCSHNIIMASKCGNFYDCMSYRKYLGRGQQTCTTPWSSSVIQAERDKSGVRTYMDKL